MLKEWGTTYAVPCIIYSLDCTNCTFSTYFFNKTLDVGGRGPTSFVVRPRGSAAVGDQTQKYEGTKGNGQFAIPRSLQC